MSKTFNGSKQDTRVDNQTTDNTLFTTASAPNKKSASSHHGVRLEQDVLFVPGPGVLPNRRVQLVVPPLPALLSRPAVELRANQTPVLGAVLEHLVGVFVC